jgi:hypothetical protein
VNKGIGGRRKNKGVVKIKKGHRKRKGKKRKATKVAGKKVEKRERNRRGGG